MSIVSLDRISLRQTAKDKKDAIRQAGALLVASGCVLPPYVEGMLAREESMSTHLGNGVAIPHGVYENKGHILKTGISVLQLTRGVEWDEAGDVRLVIGIAAQGDDHVSVLSNLANAVEDDEILAALLETGDPELIVKYLEPAEMPE